MDNYPKDLQTKVTLLIIFKKYSEDENSTTTFNKEKKDKEKKDKERKIKEKILLINHLFILEDG